MTRTCVVALSAILVAAACSGEPGPEEQAEAVPAMCASILALHSDIIDAANDMSSREVGADPAQRSAILAAGLDTFADLAEQAELPTEPEPLLVGLAERRTAAVADIRSEAIAFREQWSTVSQDERAGAVNRVFLVAERLMSELEPKITSDTPEVVVAAARDTEDCQFIVQLPPDGGGDAAPQPVPRSSQGS